MVFSVVLLLVSFGTITLLAGVSNAQMGARYRNSSQEYYAVDQRAEQHVAQIDIRLNTAENLARQYFENEAFKDPTKMPSLPTGLNFDQSLQDMLHNHWSTVVNNTNQEIYVTNLQPFINEGFRVLYYYFALNLLNAYSGIVNSVPNSDTIAVNNLGVPANYIDWDHRPIYTSTGEPITIDIMSQLRDTNNVNTFRRVNARLGIRLPEYQTITQTTQIPIRTNPIWTNAITASGSIYFDGNSSSTSTINGDVFSADRNAIFSDNFITEAQENGVISRGANVVINGNVYSRGDVHVFNNNGRITVNPYAGTVVERKNAAYQHNGLYLNSIDNGGNVDNNIPLYTQGNPAYLATLPLNPHIPLIYPDNNGGNVYCNSLSIEDVCNGANITVNGNVTTRDDVQIDGQNSEISINGNLIGVNSEATLTGNPNGSSAVMNNQPSSSRISLNGSFIVPGQTYVEFVESPYSTGISIGSLGDSGEIFDSFKTGGSETGKNYSMLTQQGIKQFSLFNGSNDQRINRIVDFLKNSSASTNISIRSINNQLVGYALGAVIARTNSSTEDEVFYTTRYGINLDAKNNIANYANNFLAYHQQSFDNILIRMMDAKTIGLGNYPFDINTNAPNTNSVIQNSFAGFVNGPIPNGIIRDNPLVLGSTITRGIVYCDGDLQIQGSGVFEGTIICNGNVNITGNPTITYSEDVISNLIQNNDGVRQFFSRGESGTQTFINRTRIDGVYRDTAVVRKRYNITQWKDSQFTPPMQGQMN